MSLPIYLRHDHWVSDESIDMIKTFLLVCKRYQSKHNIVIVKYMRYKIIAHILKMTNESIMNTLCDNIQNNRLDPANYVVDTIKYQYITTKTCTISTQQKCIILTIDDVMFDKCKNASYGYKNLKIKSNIDDLKEIEFICGGCTIDRSVPCILKDEMPF